ncbi:MAG: hypothetical protein EXS31_15050 [Pedosphaera sp.]|nr:hypothetical protein [Pedosphaera sp.]
MGQLVQMGTNAWSAVPALVEALIRENLPVGFAAASVLAQIKADDYSGWGDLAKGLKSQTNAFYVFRDLNKGFGRFGHRYDFIHRRFGLVGLAAVGPFAKPAIPDLVGVIQTKEDHELWIPAVVALNKIGAEAKQFVPALKQVLQDADEWPNIRADAAYALAAVKPEDSETRTSLRHACEDQRGHVRVAAAGALWRLEASPESVLPTLTSLLNHKLVSIRLAALNVLAEMSPSAQPSRENIEPLLRADDETLRRAAATALERIANARENGSSNLLPKLK